MIMPVIAPDVLLLTQGFYYVASGIWPIAHLRSFLAITGPKTDLWLVKTVGTLIAVIGVVLTIAGMNPQTTTEIFILAIGSQLALTTIDVFYVAAKQIPRIYLLDAVVELMFLAAWAFTSL